MLRSTMGRVRAFACPAFACLIAIASIPGSDPAVRATDAQDPPQLSVSITPSELILRAGERTITTSVLNPGDIPFSVTAAVAFPGTRLTVPGWNATVQPADVPPGGGTTVTLTWTDAPLSDVALDLRILPAGTGGMDATTLRFPIPVDVDEATPGTTSAAAIRSICTRLRTLLAEAW